MARQPAPNKTEAPWTESDEALRSLVGYRMRRASNAVQADLARTLEPFGLRMITFSALVLIIDHPGMRQSQLASGLAIERSNLVPVMDELERRELINRNPMPNDRRAYALRATLAGQRLCEKAMAAVQAHEERVLRGLSEDERDILMRALQTVRECAEGGCNVEDGKLSSA